MKKETKSLHSGSMVVFYIVCRFGWKLYLKFWERFAGFSEVYTKELGDAMLKAIADAQALPDVRQRNGMVKQQGNDLDASTKTGLLVWKKLRRFIIKAFDKPNGAAAIAQAGGAHYAKAREGNYAEVTALLTAGLTYMTGNIDLLTTKGMMPATFPADYAKAKADYDAEHLEYGEAKGDATDGTTDKIAANNALYLKLVDMFGDAQTVFADEKGIAKQFAYAAVKRLVTKDLSGIHFSVIDPLTEKPLTTAFIATDETEGALPVNERGILDLRMKVGVHSVTVTAPGRAPYSGVVKVDAGIMHRVKIALAKEEVEVMVNSEG